MKQERRSRARRVPIGSLACAFVLFGGAAVHAGPAAIEKAAAAGTPSSSCASRVNNTFNKLLECVTLDGVRSHQAALQAIADGNGGTRAAGNRATSRA